jgi:hypothetical protein
VQPAPVRGLPSKTLPEGTEVCARVRTLRYDLGNLSNAVCVVLRKVCEFATHAELLSRRTTRRFVMRRGIVRSLMILLVLVGFVLASPALACPPAGCVEIMADPVGESWGYVDATSDTGRPYRNAFVTSVAVSSVGGNETRRITLSLEDTPSYEAQDGSVITYTYVVKVYDGSILESTSSPETLLTITEPASAAPEVCDGELRYSGNCSGRGWFMCWFGGCTARKTCPGVGCVSASGGCDWRGEGGCDCAAIDIPCLNPMLVADYHADSCPSGRTCIVEVSDGINWLY